MNIYCLVFDDYETLDLMGSVEFLARVPNVKLHYVSQVGGLIRSHQRQGNKYSFSIPNT
jgi:putative intracellular protease/amidase